MSKATIYYFIGLLIVYLVYGYLSYSTKKLYPGITSEAATNIIKSLPDVKEFFRLSPDPHMTIESIDEEGSSWDIHVYEDFPDHTVTFNWYTVHKQTGEVTERVASPTVFVDFTPHDYLETPSQAGKCWQSIASSSSKAYRCSDEGNTIYDPCFQIETQVVACYNDPESPAIAVIETTEALVKNETKEESLPWVSVLEGGDKCYIMTGTGMPIKGKTYHLSCIIAGDQDVYGEVVADSYLWKMRLVSPTHDTANDPVKITTVYK